MEMKIHIIRSFDEAIATGNSIVFVDDTREVTVIPHLRWRIVVRDETGIMQMLDCHTEETVKYILQAKGFDIPLDGGWSIEQLPEF